MQKYFVAFLFLMAASLVLYKSYSQPRYNWDIVGYVAATKSIDTKNKKLLHRATYLHLKRTLPKRDYAHLHSNRYERRVATDPDALQEQLPYYQIRPFYIGLLYLASKVGVSLSFATHFVSALAVVLGLFLLYLLSLRYLPNTLSATLPVFALLYGAIEIGQLSTPDGLAYLSLFLLVLLFLRRQYTLLFLCLPLSLTIRTDLLLFHLPLLALLFLSHTRLRKKVALTSVGLVAIYLFINHTYNHPGWSTLMFHTFLHPQPYPFASPPPFAPEHFFQILSKGLSSLPTNKPFLLFVLLASAFLIKLKEASRAHSWTYLLSQPFVQLTLVCIIFTVSHFLAFPAIWSRFFAASYTIATFSLLALYHAPLTGHPTKTTEN